MNICIHCRCLMHPFEMEKGNGNECMGCIDPRSEDSYESELSIMECLDCGTALTMEESDWNDGLCGPCQAEEERDIEIDETH